MFTIKKNLNGNNNIDLLTYDQFNEYFTNIGINIATKFTDTNSGYRWKLPESIHDFIFSPITEDFVFKELNKLTLSSNLDILGIDSKLLKISMHYIFGPLTYIFNLSLQSGCMPDDWKRARVNPIYKNNGAKNKCNNYRPLSVISHVAKIAERAVQKQLLTYLCLHKLAPHSKNFVFLHNLP